VTEPAAPARIDLGVVDDELACCVACGLCLPHCPTYRVTGEEALSPRGRIAAMRQVQWEGADPDAAFVRSMATCVQCRGCETACPSGVPFGHLIEAAKRTLAEGVLPAPIIDIAAERGRNRVRPAARRPSATMRLGLRALGHHRLLLLGSSLLGLAQRLHLVPRRLSRRLGLPDLVPVRRPRRRGSGTDVWLFTGCVMDAWMRDVHADVQRLIEAAGGGVALPGGDAACCGALALHAGLGSDARRRAERTVRAFPGDAPILVDAAGCGAMLEDYGRLLGTAEAEAFSARVRDIHEWLAERVDRLPPPPVADDGRSRLRVAVQDPCHLRHVQCAHQAVRTVLSRYAEVVELDDEGLCCGAGGAYALTQPELAGAIRERKLAAIARSGTPLVASANPGCVLHLAAGGVDAVHPCQIVAQVLAEAPDQAGAVMGASRTAGSPRS
jgi:glycolate dehydrogenase iron-sulfur subunit